MCERFWTLPPFARPAFAEILGALDFVIAKNYLARGEVIDHTNI